jgi:lysozyme
MAIVMTAVVPEIQQFEGYRSVPYHDIHGVLTVCNGHTGPDVVVKKVYSQSECADLTAKDASKAADGILKVSPHLKYHPMQLAAAISFGYNVGVGNYAKSSVASNFNTGNFQAGCSALLKYTYSGGVYSKGLDARRHYEYDICTSTLTPKGLVNVGVSTQPS